MIEWSDLQKNHNHQHLTILFQRPGWPATQEDILSPSLAISHQLFFAAMGKTPNPQRRAHYRSEQWTCYVLRTMLVSTNTQIATLYIIEAFIAQQRMLQI